MMKTILLLCVIFAGCASHHENTVYFGPEKVIENHSLEKELRDHKRKLKPKRIMSSIALNAPGTK